MRATEWKKTILLAASLLWVLLSIAQGDTASKAPKRGVPRPYKEVITNKAISEAGLFKVHRLEDRWFFEVPDSLLEREILVVNRVSKAATGIRMTEVGYSGDQIGENVIAFSKGPNNKLFIKSISYLQRSVDSTQNGMYRSVLNSNIQPIVAAFDIKTYSPDSTGSVIDVTDYVNGDNDILFFNALYKPKFEIGALQADKSYIQSIRSFPLNIEIRTLKTYGNAIPILSSTKTFELNSSMVLLPKVPMRSRYFDERVGYFATGYYDFDSDPQSVQSKSVITRWRIEPKDEDINKYERGELVEPKKPIVFYIDPATPRKWIPYLIQGVTDWQKAFEKAGFKNAIYALEAPTNDPEWSLEDAGHNAIVYKPSTEKNASGPHVHDPRSGEIIETHINWYHNVMSLIHDWYMIQAGAIDPKARSMEFDDSLMGQLIRFVCSHEVGHTLGLLHNFGASSTVPVDSLRSKRWVEANGHTPSIMDYARFNYVAQPEDSISELGIFPRIGVYDEWAIQWGYRWFSPDQPEKQVDSFLNKWVISSQNRSNSLWFGQERAMEFDPRCRAEDLGDNAMKASFYGIQNLKRIIPHLIEWTKEPGQGYNDLMRMYNAIVKQYTQYLFHVASNVGGFMVNAKTSDQPGNVMQFVAKERQQDAVFFLRDQLFNEPTWLMDPKIYSVTGVAGGGYEIYQMADVQQKVIKKVLSHTTLGMLLRFQIFSPSKAYTVKNLLDDLRTSIWSEIYSQKAISMYRRSLQKVYTEQLAKLILEPDMAGRNTWSEQGYAKYNSYTDIPALIKIQIQTLINQIDKALPAYKDELTKYHLKDVREQLKEALHPSKNLKVSAVSTSGNQN
jgi:hypothetical protein